MPFLNTTPPERFNAFAWFRKHKSHIALIDETYCGDEDSSTSLETNRKAHAVDVAYLRSESSPGEALYLLVPEDVDSESLEIRNVSRDEIQKIVAKTFHDRFILVDAPSELSEALDAAENVLATKRSVCVVLTFGRRAYPDIAWIPDSQHTYDSECKESKGGYQRPSTITCYEHGVGLSNDILQQFPFASFDRDADLLRVRGSETTRTVLNLSQKLERDLIIFGSNEIFASYGKEDVLDRNRSAIVLVNSPYGAWAFEQGLYSQKNISVYSIDAAAIARILSVPGGASAVVNVALQILLARERRQSLSSEDALTLYVEENGLVEISSVRKGLPPRQDKSDTYRPRRATSRIVSDVHKRLKRESLVSTSVSKVTRSELYTATLTSNRVRSVRKSRQGQWRIRRNVRLTSPDYGRDLNHVELVRDGADVSSYLPGQILKVRPTNPADRVHAFFSKMGWDSNALIATTCQNQKNHQRLTTIGEHARTSLELFALPSSQFCRTLKKRFLANSASNDRVKSIAKQLDFLADNPDLMRSQALTYAGVLNMFSSALATFEVVRSYDELVSLRLIPEIAFRSYSIASCADVVGKNRVDLIVVRETWNTCENLPRAGLCSSFLCDVSDDTYVTAEIDTSTSLALADPTTDIVMIGFGTGIAPMRAFCQWYYALRAKGQKTGKIALYFGARTSSNENMYGFEMFLLRQMCCGASSHGPIVQLRQAFSRDDPKKKVYVQHLMEEDKTLIQNMLGSGVLMLCGPTRPVDSACKVVSDVCGVNTGNLADEGRLLVESY